MLDISCVYVLDVFSHLGSDCGEGGGQLLLSGLQPKSIDASCSKGNSDYM